MISYIVPAYNCENTIERCVESIVRQRGEKEVLVVDNGSTDQTPLLLDRLARKYDFIKVLREEKRGPAAARNKGLARASGEHVAFVDSDVELPMDWAEKAVEKLEKHEAVAGVGGPARNAGNTLLSELFNPLFLYHMKSWEEETPSLATMNAMFKGSAIEGERFDDSLVTAEDPEFCFRLRRKGYTLLLSRDLEVLHNHPATLGEIVKRWFHYGEYYHLPFLRYPENITFFFLYKVIYLPALVLFTLLSLLHRSFLMLPLAMTLSVFAAYAWIGWKGLESTWAKAAFPFLHLLKFHVHLAGLWYGMARHGLGRKGA